ncbi:MAG: hypothetical protein L6Q35_16660 [Phycisphaerales bacterium]|nr:hypothetical protein [Phycisphaerales bacterium]
MLETLPGLVTLANDDIAKMGIVGGLSLATISVVGGLIFRTVRARAFEASRREIAAYVAEGSISADDASKLLAAGQPLGRGR